MKKNNIIPFNRTKKEMSRVNTVLSRTTADAVKEDMNLMTPIMREEYDSEGNVPSLKNHGDDLVQMLLRTRKIKADAGIVDQYITEDAFE